MSPNKTGLQRFEQLPFVRLIPTPTPLLPLSRLTSDAGAPVFIKRDDLNGVGIGGNKVRKLEYLLADAIEKGADSLVTGGGIQSNHAAATAICGKRFNLSTYLALVDGVPKDSQHYHHGGNLVIDQLCEARIHRFPAGNTTNDSIRQLADQIELQSGKRPYEICMGGSDQTGALGYIRAALEIVEQTRQQGVSLDQVIHASGSAGTQAGLTVGFVLAGVDIKVVGCSVLHPESILRGMVASLCHQVAAKLGIRDIDWENKIHIDDGYIGKGYGIASNATWQSIQRGIARESVVFDPCYTGKAFNCLLDRIDNGSLSLSSGTLFLHTGGMSGLFGYAEEVPVRQGTQRGLSE